MILAQGLILTIVLKYFMTDAGASAVHQRCRVSWYVGFDSYHRPDAAPALHNRTGLMNPHSQRLQVTTNSSIISTALSNVAPEYLPTYKKNASCFIAYNFI